MDSFIQTALFDGQWSVWVPLAVFATGLLTSLTPCVYPMLPITVAVVGSHSTDRRQAFFLSLFYVLGLSLTYAILGVFAASSGQLFGSVASHPVTLLLVAFMCLLFSAWMLGWLRMPALQLPDVPAAGRMPPFMRVMLSGAVSGLVLAPCTSPVFGMLLMYVAGQGSVPWALLLMFVFALGMSALLLAAGTFSGMLARLPKSGRWLLLSQRLLAGLMLLAAVWFSWQALQPF